MRLLGFPYRLRTSRKRSSHFRGAPQCCGREDQCAPRRRLLTGRRCEPYPFDTLSRDAAGRDGAAIAVADLQARGRDRQGPTALHSSPMARLRRCSSSCSYKSSEITVDSLLLTGSGRTTEGNPEEIACSRTSHGRHCRASCDRAAKRVTRSKVGSLAEVDLSLIHISEPTRQAE